MAKLFGTDGIRGVANQELTAELALAVGRASALVLGEGEQGRSLLIGRDPRLSGQMLEGALVAGITSAGLDVILVDVVPTPAVAFLTKALGCAGGVMISASHNPLEDNGIKIFGFDGYKLTDAQEGQIEALIPGDDYPRPIAGGLGRVYHKSEAGQLYIQELKNQVPLDLSGLHVALDCANGATSTYASQLFRGLGAKVSAFFDQPNGININHFCGSTVPEKIQSLTKEVGADVGFAFDGDGDRVLAVDEQGNLVDGDHILAIVGLHLLRNGQLPAKKVIATAYSNGGLRQAFLASGGDVQYAPVGDRFVLETMLQEGCVLGGEQSGHILFLENSTTGDGMLTALKLLEMRQIQKKQLAELARSMAVFPQCLVNVPVRDKRGWQDNPRIQEAIKEAQVLLGPLGRLFVRASGTEPLLRVLGEHPEEQVLEEAVQLVVQAITTEQGSIHVS